MGTLERAAEREPLRAEVEALRARLEGMEGAAQEREAELARTRTALELAQARLRELDRMKSAFLSSVSHELRTPLTSINGFAKLLRKDLRKVAPPEPEQDVAERLERMDGNLRIIALESRRLTQIILDVLDLAQMESEASGWNDEPVQVCDAMRSAAAAAAALFAERPAVQLVVEEPFAPLPRARVDRQRLLQVLGHMLENAAKFTEAGEVRLSAELDNQGSLLLCVEDTGRGVPRGESRRIFDLFHQALPDDYFQQPRGTGVGLTVCRKVVEHYGGRVWVESELGQGSRFCFTLPADTDAGDHAP